MHIAYLSSRLTLPKSPDRRYDAFEHDEMIACLSPALDEAGGTLTAVAWDDQAADWAQFDAAIIGSTWDYQDRYNEFFAILEKIEHETALYNPSKMVRWNGRKTYLHELEQSGVATVPTIWCDQATPEAIEHAFDALDCDDLIVKRQIGANAEGQFRLKRGDEVPMMPEPMMIQPFLRSIQSEGELSFIFIDGDFSHALLKKAAKGEYRIQSSYGGSEQAIHPNDADIATAANVIATLPEMPLYARVDMVRGPDDRLLLMELELIEPYLYPVQAKDLGKRLVKALATRLG